MIVIRYLCIDFEQAKQALENNDEAHLLYQSFLKSKEKYDEVMRLGNIILIIRKLSTEQTQKSI